MLYVIPLYRYPDLEAESQCLIPGTTSLLVQLSNIVWWFGGDSQMFLFLKLVEVYKCVNFLPFKAWGMLFSLWTGLNFSCKACSAHLTELREPWTSSSCCSTRCSDKARDQPHQCHPLSHHRVMLRALPARDPSTCGGSGKA